MRHLKIVIKKLFYPILHLKKFLSYISKFYEYVDGLVCAKNNFSDLKNVKSNFKLQQNKSNKNNRLINYYLNTKHRGMTKFLHYLLHYENYFNYLKKTKKKIKILEIGVFSGGSLDLYKKFFGKKNVKILGIDIDKECLKFNDKITKIEIGDQENEIFLKKIKKKYSHFDLIVDDGGHTCEQQKKSFEILFPILSTGGIYIIEDTTHRFIAYINGFLNEFNEFRIENNQIKTSNVQKQIMKIEIIPNCVIVRKYLERDIPSKFSAPWIGNFWTKSAKKVYNKYNPNSNRFKK